MWHMCLKMEVIPMFRPSLERWCRVPARGLPIKERIKAYGCLQGGVVIHGNEVSQETGETGSQTSPLNCQLMFYFRETTLLQVVHLNQELILNVSIYVYIYIYTQWGSSLNGGTPNHPKLDHVLVLKPMVLGIPPVKNPIYIYVI